MPERRQPLSEAEVQEVVEFLSKLFHDGHICLETYYLSAFLVADAVVDRRAD